PWVDGTTFRACLHDGGVIQNAACMGTHLAVLDAFVTGTPGLATVSGAALWSKIAWECEAAGSLAAAEAQAAQILGYLKQPLDGSAVAASCGDALRPTWRASHPETIVVSVDPNAKVGPTGIGAANQVSGTPLTYSIRFENLQTATADVQELSVTDPLDDT